jgi:osmoprotectant transport system permease protein
VARRARSRDSVAITGCVVGLASSLAGWLVLRPNRLAAGAGLGLWDSFGTVPAMVIAGLWLLCLVLSLLGNGRRNAIALGVALNLVVTGVFLFSGLAAARLLESAPSLTRVSPGAGVWLSVAGAYVAIFSCRRRLGGLPVWQGLVSWSGLVAVVSLLAAGHLNSLSVMVEFRQQQSLFLGQLRGHIALFVSSVAAGTLIGVPLGLWAARSRRAERPVSYITGIVQTIPSLALFGLLIAPLAALSFAFPILRQWGISGIGAAPAVIALTLYSLLPVVRNTYAGIRQIEPAVINAGRGMGMSQWQLFRRIEVPLAAPLVLEGVRTASVQAVGNAAVAALIGAGGLGWFIFQGIAQATSDVVILGALPIIGLALIVDQLMRGVVKIATPRGLAGR